MRTSFLQRLYMLDVEVVIVVSKPDSCAGNVRGERLYYYPAPSSVRLPRYPLGALAHILGKTGDYIVQLQVRKPKVGQYLP